MNAELIVTILCGLAIAVGVVGTIIPVLPGSILIGASLLVWAIWGGAGPMGWVIFAIGMVIFVVALVRWIRSAREEMAGLPLDH